MNIFQLSNKSGIPLAKLRKLESLKVLSVDPDNGFTESLIFHMRGNQQLSVAQLLALIEQPDLLDELGAAKPRYAGRARLQIAAIGDLSQHQAPREITAAIMGASRCDDDAGLIIADWLKSVLPAAPVGNAWVALRCLAPLNEFLRGQTAPLISPALLNVRKLPEFAGYWRSAKIGTRSHIFYSQPAIDRLDL